MIARGEFEVNLLPVETAASMQDGIQFFRMTISKTFQGDLNAGSQGEMLSVLTKVDGSAGYVAVEQVEGSLQGKQGTFVLQHYGMSNRGEQSLVLEIVPDSGTDELRGISGQMLIKIDGGKHFYQLDYGFDENQG